MVAGEPYDMKVSSTVRRGVDGKGAQATSPAAHPTRSREDASRYIPAYKGVCFPEKLREDMIAGLIVAKHAPEVEKLEGEQFRSVKIVEIPVSQTECWRISKGSGAKNAFVDIRKFMAREDGAFFPSKTKGVSILETSLEDVILGLMRTEPEHEA